MADYDSKPVPPRVQNLIGNTYGRWTVIGFSGYRGHRRKYWICKCDCGSVKAVYQNSLKAGKSTSCGCYHREVVAEMGRANQTHGMSDSLEYSSWKSMIERCENVNDDSYENYGGRGIAVCERWRESFELFYEDMGERPSSNHSIHRINNDEDYTPENCKWAAPKEQARNRTSNHCLTYKGKTQTVVEWAEEVGITPNALYLRIKSGWSVERALTEPSHT